MSSVLVVEDERLVARMLEKFLRAANLDVRLAYSGTDAWNILSGDSPPFVALIDWNIPSINGPELCRKVRERVDLHFVYMILVTGRFSRQDISAGKIDAGADEYIAKPFEVERVVERAKNGLAVARARRDGSSPK